MRARRRTGHLGMSEEARSQRGNTLGGSDARIIMSGDQEAIERLWKEKRGEAPQQDFSNVLLVQMGNVMEPLILDWFEGETGLFVTDEQDRCIHPDHDFAACTLDGRVRETIDGPRIGILEAKFMMPYNWNLDSAIKKYQPQFQWNSFVTQEDRIWGTIVTGAATFSQIEMEADPFYQHEVFNCVCDFWECVKSGKVPGNPIVEPPKVEAIRVVDMSGSNAWANDAANIISTAEAARVHEASKKSIKAQMPSDAKEASGYGVTVSRSKTGRMTIKTNEDIAELVS